jgi:hypothetical protein
MTVPGAGARLAPRTPVGHDELLPEHDALLVERLLRLVLALVSTLEQVNSALRCRYRSGRQSPETMKPAQ